MPNATVTPMYRDREVKKLRALAKRMQKAVDLINVAATYWDDGAYATANERLERASAGLLNGRGYLAFKRWHVRGPRNA